MTIHEKQSFVTGELTALLKRIDPSITGAAYTESNTKAHVVIFTLLFMWIYLEYLSLAAIRFPIQ